MNLTFADSVNFTHRKRKKADLRSNSGRHVYTYSRCWQACLSDTSKPRLGSDSRLPLISPTSCSHRRSVACTGRKGSLSHLLDSKFKRNSAPGPVLREVTFGADIDDQITSVFPLSFWGSWKTPGKQSLKLHHSSPELGPL